MNGRSTGTSSSPTIQVLRAPGGDECPALMAFNNAANFPSEGFTRRHDDPTMDSRGRVTVSLFDGGAIWPVNQVHEMTQEIGQARFRGFSGYLRLSVETPLFSGVLKMAHPSGVEPETF